MKLVKRISERIWDKPDWYSAEMILESKIMKGLWQFVSYCETYYDDLALVKRVHLNLSLIIEIFQNIINNSVKAKHKFSFKQQRESMLPPDGFQPNQADSINVEPSIISRSFYETSELGTDINLGISETSISEERRNIDYKRELEEAYRDLVEQTRVPRRQAHSTVARDHNNIAKEEVLSVSGTGEEDKAEPVELLKLQETKSLS